MTEYQPEGNLYASHENQSCLRSFTALDEARESRRILEAPCVVCDSRHNLIVDLGCMRGFIPREDGALGISEGTTKDIALISRVNKIVCFIVVGFAKDENDFIYAVLSRRSAQEECLHNYLEKLRAGDVIPARVTHLEQFGCFVDVGCGIPSLIPIDLISVSRIAHPSDRFFVGQNIRAVIKSIENGRICLSHKELLGTWQENAALFEMGETVTGVVRSVESYGVFVELAPNLAGLAEPHEGVTVNSRAGVYIKAIIPEKMKVKLIIVSTSDNAPCAGDIKYFIDSGHIDSWVYSCEGSGKNIRTDFV